MKASVLIVAALNLTIAGGTHSVGGLGGILALKASAQPANGDEEVILTDPGPQLVAPDAELEPDSSAPGDAAEDGGMTRDQPDENSARRGDRATRPSTVGPNRSRPDREAFQPRRNAPPSRDRDLPTRGMSARPGNRRSPSGSEDMANGRDLSNGEKAGSGSLPNRDYAAFKIIADRNIFDANRRPGSGGSRGEARRPASVDTLTLVGTLSYEKGPYAFFDGSSSEFRKVIESGKTIAGCRILEISGNTVKLEYGTNKLELCVGMQMRREESEWRVLGSAKAPPSATANKLSESAADSLASDESDIVKRLMQQREQESK